jgi:predicted ATPase
VLNHSGGIYIVSEEQKIQLRVVNFGPIDKANIQLTNCSFFAGNNNVGKSVMAQLLYSILKVFSPTMEEVSNYLPELIENEFISLVEEVVAKSPKTKPKPKKKSKGKKTKSTSETVGGTWKVSQKDLNTISSLSRKNKKEIRTRINAQLSAFFHEALKEKIRQEMMYVFSSSIYDYVRIGQSNAKLLFEYKDNLYDCIHTMGIYRKSQSIRSETGIKVNSAFLDSYIQDMFKLPLKHLKGKTIKYKWEKGKLIVKFPLRSTPEKVYNLPRDTYQPWKVYYIPAGRAGLLEGYRIVSNAFYKAAPLASISDGKQPSITGVVADFYSLLMSFDGTKGHYNEMALDMLSRTMGGVLEMDSDEYPFSVMKYRIRSADDHETVMDVTKASSMVKELAPIFMVVSEKLNPNDILIIEEPESHLQSKTQMELADFFFNLSKDGVRILLTTHSELMLRQSFQLFNQKDLPITGNLFIFKESSHD